MVLSIDRIYVQHFRRYYFEAANQLGTTVHKIELQRGETLAVHVHEAVTVPYRSTGSTTLGALRNVFFYIYFCTDKYLVSSISK